MSSSIFTNNFSSHLFSIIFIYLIEFYFKIKIIDVFPNIFKAAEYSLVLPRYCGLTVSSQISFTEDLTPHILLCDCIWRQGFKR